ncbi:metal-dependent hydrolase family protein [Winogradskyella aurantiaca]|uniref:metal-dependent hydrolase family protein n=1 Tax=Winogradskyella aurantiaca TaxID=2219558 RepID=UPI0018E526F3|nr:amidohydrolase family protein [Winogradskyella aurantiaca]
MKTYTKGLMACAFLFSFFLSTAQNENPSFILITNVQVWNGTSTSLINADVLIENNLIKEVGANLKRLNDATIIDGKGGVVMPGLIEGHGHLQMNGTSISDIENNRNWEELAVRSVVNAENALMSGFTSWRDAGGMGAGLKKTIDAGLLKGPRIYPSGGFIGPTGSHADFRNFNTPNESVDGVQSNGGRLGMTLTADGVDAIKAAARQNFMQGASQIKIMSSGGVVSQFDPWQLDAYSADEIRAAVEVANAYGSYVMSHAYSKKSIMRCLENGVRSIEHGFMFDGDVAALMEEKNAYMTTNMQAFSPALDQVSAITASAASTRKANSAQKAFKDYIENVKKYRPKLGFQGDCVGMPESCNKQNDHQIYLGAEFFGNHYYLMALTSVNGEILKLSGDVLDPYPEGKLGVIEPGAYADLLIVDGNPLKDITVIGGNEQWFDAPVREGIESMKVIMKDGVIYKNTLE